MILAEKPGVARRKINFEEKKILKKKIFEKKNFEKKFSKKKILDFF